MASAVKPLPVTVTDSPLVNPVEGVTVMLGVTLDAAETTPAAEMNTRLVPTARLAKAAATTSFRAGRVVVRTRLTSRQHRRSAA